MRLTFREVIAMAIIAVSTIVLWKVMTNFPFVRVIENYVQDLRVAVLTPAMPQNQDIVVVTITDDTLRRFPFRSPVNRQFLAELIRRLEAAAVRGIGIDILFDTPTLPDDDRALKAVFDTAQVPIVVSYGNTASTEGAVTPEQVAFMDAFTANIDRGFANLTKDSADDVVRDIYPGWIDWQPPPPPQDTGDLVLHQVRGIADSILGTPADKPPAEAALQLGIAQKLARIAGVSAFSRDFVHLDYHGRPVDPAKQFPFPRFESHTLLKLPPAILKRWFEGRLVLIGADLSAIDLDLHRTPYHTLPGASSGELPGVVIHAHALAQLLDGRQFPQAGAVVVWGLLIAAAVLGVLVGRLEIGLLLLSGAVVVVIIAYWAIGFLLYEHGEVLSAHASTGPMIPLIGPSVTFGIATFASMAFFGQQQRAQRAFIKDAFSRYLSPALVDDLMQNPDSLTIRGQKREMSLIFTDVAGFTTFSESVEPELLVAVLNEYLEGMCQIILGYGGTIDKFIGDAIFVLFGAPVEMDDHASRAVKCAIDLDAYAEAFRKEKNDIGIPFGLTRIGVHTGLATVGNFGSETRFEYTALGDSVNSAARLESLNKQFGTRVAVSGEAKKHAADVAFRPIASVIVKGKTEPIDIHSPVSPQEAETDLFRDYCQAYALLEAQDPGARQAFLALGETFPDDSLVRLHARRVADGELTAVMKLTEK